MDGRAAAPKRTMGVAFALAAGALAGLLLLAGCGGTSGVTTSSLGAGTTEVAVTTSVSSTDTTLAPTTSSEAATTSTAAPETTTSTEATTTTTLAETTTTAAPVLAWVRYQDGDSHFKYSGTHSKWPYDKASGGTYTELRKGAKLTIAFTGTRVRVAAIPMWTAGIVVISIAGKTKKVDLWSELDFPDAFSKIVWTSSTLTYGKHTLVISNTGLMNPVSDGAIDRIDAVDIKGTIGS